MGSVAVLMPSLRPERWDAIAKRLERTAPDATLYPLGDEFGSYAEAINESWAKTTEPYLFLAADDLIYGDGWLEAALAELKGPALVVGTNDTKNPYVLDGLHSTHSLVARLYLQTFGGVIDQGPGSCLYPYDHSYTDAEFIETARHRKMFAPCLASVVAHVHPDFGEGERDAVYQRTLRKMPQDFQTFMSRRHLFPTDPELRYLEPECATA